MRLFSHFQSAPLLCSVVIIKRPFNWAQECRVLCCHRVLCLVSGCVYALFPRIREKKAIVAADCLIWGSKARHMLGAGSASPPNTKKKTAAQLTARTQECIQERTFKTHRHASALLWELMSPSQQLGSF